MKINEAAISKRQEETLNRMAAELQATSGFQWRGGMLPLVYEYGEWVANQRIDKYLEETSYPTPSSIPDLQDAATIGCLQQDAWRIVERERTLAMEAKRSHPPLVFNINGDMVMNNVEPPPVVSLWARHLQVAALQGITSPEAVIPLIEIFFAIEPKEDG